MMGREKISNILRENGLDAILVSDACNMRYLSGFRGGTGYLFLSEKRRVLLTDARYTVQAGGETEDFEIAEVSAKRNYETVLKEILGEEQTVTLGFEDLHLIFARARKLQEELGDIRWVALGDSLNRLRRVKTPEEQKLLEQAEAIGDLAFCKILEELRPGLTELQVAARLDYYMKEAGASGNSFDTIAASGVHSAMPHAMPSGKKLEKGDFLTMDFGCVYQGYCSDMTRTVVIGKANERQKEIYQIVLEAQEAALEAIRPGMTGAMVDRVARDLIADAGYGEYFGHGLGHSVGLYIHEEPRLSPSCEDVLCEGIIQTVEPGIYLPDFGGVRIEDMVVITAEGCRNLTRSTKELQELN